MTVWYYGEGGNNANSGLSYALRKQTYANFSGSIAAGDTIYICAAAAGVLWYNTEQINVVSGSSGNVVTYKVYPGHYVVMDVTTSGDGAAIQGASKSYFRIEPGDGYLILGRQSDYATGWTYNSGTGVWTFNGNTWTGYSARHQLYFTNCNNFALVGTGTGDWNTTNSNFVVFGGSAYEGNVFDEDCDLVFIQGLDFSRHGTNNTGSLYAENADEGDLLGIFGTHFFLYRCCFQLGGHQNIAIKSRLTVVDTCDFDGDWTGFTPNSDEGRGAPIERSGSRSFAIVAADVAHGAQSPYGPTLVQNCIMQNAGSSGDDPSNANAKTDGQHVIFRQNYLWDGNDAAIITATYYAFGDGTLGQIKIYNNTMYGNGRICDIRSSDYVFDDTYVQCDFINNICDKQVGAYYGSTIKQFRRRASGEATEGYANGWKGGRYSANIASMASTAPEGTSVTVEFRNFGGAVENYTWTTVDNTYPSNWTSSNVVGSPTYLGNPASGTRTKVAFTPNGGIETDAADPHAIANGAGTPFSSTLIVDSGQARMFKDEWGMSSLGVEADWIKIGSGEPVQISSINYATDTITLTEPRTWSDNAEVYWCTTEDGVNFTVFEDIGAGQTPGSVTPAPDPDAPVHSTKVMVFR
jgi:hypothetical protein